MCYIVPTMTINCYKQGGGGAGTCIFHSVRPQERNPFVIIKNNSQCSDLISFSLSLSTHIRFLRFCVYFFLSPESALNTKIC